MTYHQTPLSRYRVCRTQPNGRVVCRVVYGRALGDDVVPVTAGGLSSITGAPIAVDAAHITELQKQVNRFADPKAPANFTALGAPLPTSGILDDATALRAVQILVGYSAITPGSDFDTTIVGLLPTQKTQWVSSHLTTTYSTIKAFADSLGLPAASMTITPLMIAAAVALAAAILLSGKKKHR